MQFLRANTEVIVTVGPCVDVTDGFTPQTDIGLAGNEAELIKHGATAVVDVSGNTFAAVTSCRGYYSLTLTTTDTNTEGMLVFVLQDDSDMLPLKQEYMVLSEAAYDSLCVAKDAGFMDVNIKTIGRTDTQETEADNLETACAASALTADVTTWLGTAAATPTVAGVPEVDVTHQGGGAVPAPAVTGVPDVNLTHHVDVAASVSNGELDVNVGSWLGTAAATPTVAGVPEVDVTHQGGGAVPAPAVTGVPDVNMTHHVDVAASVTNGELDVNVGQIIGTAPSLTGGEIDVNVASEDNIDFGATKKLSLNTEVDNAWTTAIPDSVPADGTIPTREQALYMIVQGLTEFAISGTTVTVKKVDGTTTLVTYTLDDATNPTSRTRAT